MPNFNLSVDTMTTIGGYFMGEKLVTTQTNDLNVTNSKC